MFAKLNFLSEEEIATACHVSAECRHDATTAAWQQLLNIALPKKHVKPVQHAARIRTDKSNPSFAFRLDH